MRKVLLLNSTYEPLNLLTVKQVMKKLYKENSPYEVEKYYENMFMACGKGKMPIPAVVRLKYHLELHKKKKGGFSKRSKIYQRDNYMCAYCNRQIYDSKRLSLDHIIPKSKGGRGSTDNLVTSCKSCNNKKSDRTPEEAGMRIKIPRHVLLANIDKYLLREYTKNVEEWKGYIYYGE